MKIIIFSRYDDSQASTRVRFNQYLPYLKKEEIKVEIFHILPSNGVLKRNKNYQFWITRFISYFKVVAKLFERNFLLHIQYELFPFIPFFIEYILIQLSGKKKYIIELDDAWFHRYDSSNSLIVRLFLRKKIDLLMKKSWMVIAGNKYIAERAQMAGAKRIEIIPTVVDVELFKKFKSSSLEDKNQEQEKKPVVGWIGTPSTTKCLLVISDQIKILSQKNIAEFIALGADPEMIKGLPVTVIPWSKNTEFETLFKFDIGIMPLAESLFERGKCGFKLIQYMACSIPVVASPVGVNNEIVVHNETGYLASTHDEWVNYLTNLCINPNIRRQFGECGMLRVERMYSLKAYSEKYVSLLKSFVSEL